MYKEIKGYELNEKKYKYSLQSNSFINLFNFALSHMIMWVYAIYIIYTLNFITALFNTTTPKGQIFREDAFDVVIPIILFFFVYYILMLLFSRDDDYKLRKNADNKYKHIIAAFWLLFGPIQSYKTYKKFKS